MTVQASTIMDLQPGNIQEVADWSGKKFGELLGYRFIDKNVRILSHTEGFAIFLPEDIWGKLNYQVPISFPEKKIPSCWIADKNFAFMSDNSIFSRKGRKFINVEVTLNIIESIVKKFFFEKDLIQNELTNAKTQLHQLTRSENLTRTLCVYKIHAFQIFLDLTNKLNECNGESLNPNAKIIVQSLSAWYKFKKNNILVLRENQVLSLKPWIDHLSSIISSINHELELKELDFSQPISVTTQYGEEVNAYLKLDEGYFNYGYKNRVKLISQRKVIGKMEFEFCKNPNFFFVSRLQNCTITMFGEKEYTRVGTALLDFSKKACSDFGYSSICLTAQTPLNTPLPETNNLVSFYKKNGFELNDSYGSNIMGYRMIWHNTSATPLQHFTNSSYQQPT